MLTLTTLSLGNMSDFRVSRTPFVALREGLKEVTLVQLEGELSEMILKLDVTAIKAGLDAFEVEMDTSVVELDAWRVLCAEVEARLAVGVAMTAGGIGDLGRETPSFSRRPSSFDLLFPLESVLGVLECDPPILGDRCVGLAFVFEFVIDGSVSNGGKRIKYKHMSIASLNRES